MSLDFRFLAAFITALVGISATAQTYPNKLIRVVTSEAGGGLDVAARITTDGLRESIGQQVIVENRGGGNGSIAALAVARAAPDGYTLLFYGTAFWIQPLLQDNISYDPVKDFSPITISVGSPNMIVVHPAVEAKSVKDLIALVRARPGQLNYATGSSGATPHLAAELFKAMTGTNIVRINYKGGGSALNAVIAGEVQLMFANATLAMQQVKSGRLRALAVTGDKPSVLMPGLPTVAASGLPGYSATTVLGYFAPANTPSAIISKLNQEIVRVGQKPDIEQKFLNNGLEPIGSTPAELAAQIKSEMTILGKVIKDAGIRAE